MVVENIAMSAVPINKKDYPPEYREQCPDIKNILKRNIRNRCNRNLLLDRLPIVKWFPKYQWNYLFQDAVAGLTVGLTAIPQGIAYAVVAGLEPQYGLYSGFVGCFVYMVLGSCKDITIGPTAIMALMIQKYVHDSPDFAVLIAFLSGLIIFMLGVLNLGFLVQFISIPVTIGFTSAAAITIGSSQIKSLLGLPGTANDFLDAWENVFRFIGETKLWDTVLGISTVIFLLLLQKLKDVRGRMAGVCKYVSLSRNAMAVFIGTLLAYLLSEENGDAPFALTGKVASGFPEVRPPPFSTTIGNETLYFNDMISGLGSSLIAIPLISILESIAIAKAFSKGKTIDATQELIALGMCNVIGSFFSSMPTTGSFTRTAVNNASGVRTTLGGIFTGILILLSLGFLTDTFQYIPKATLAAVIISAMFFMVDYQGAWQIWRTRRLDIIPLIGALIACLLLGLEYGILIGIGLNVVFLLYTTSRPKIQFEITKSAQRDIMIVVPDQSLIFSAAEHFKYKLLKHVLQNPTIQIIILNGEYVQTIDATVAKTFESIVDDIQIQKRQILFWNWKQQPIGVAWRLNRQFGNLFFNAPTIDELLIHVKFDDMNGNPEHV